MECRQARPCCTCVDPGRRLILLRGTRSLRPRIPITHRSPEACVAQRPASLCWRFLGLGPALAAQPTKSEACINSSRIMVCRPRTAIAGQRKKEKHKMPCPVNTVFHLEPAMRCRYGEPPCEAPVSPKWIVDGKSKLGSSRRRRNKLCESRAFFLFPSGRCPSNRAQS